MINAYLHLYIVIVFNYMYHNYLLLLIGIIIHIFFFWKHSNKVIKMPSRLVNFKKHLQFLSFDQQISEINFAIDDIYNFKKI